MKICSRCALTFVQNRRIYRAVLNNSIAQPIDIVVRAGLRSTGDRVNYILSTQRRLRAFQAIGNTARTFVIPADRAGSALSLRSRSNGQISGIGILLRGVYESITMCFLFLVRNCTRAGVYRSASRTSRGDIVEFNLDDCRGQFPCGKKFHHGGSSFAMRNFAVSGFRRRGN